MADSTEFNGERAERNITDSIVLITTQSNASPAKIRYEVSNSGAKSAEVTLDFGGSQNIRVDPSGRGTSAGSLAVSGLIGAGSRPTLLAIAVQIDPTADTAVAVSASSVVKGDPAPTPVPTSTDVVVNTVEDTVWGSPSRSTVTDGCYLITTKSTSYPITAKYEVDCATAARVRVQLDFSGCANVHIIQPYGASLAVEREYTQGASDLHCIVQQVSLTAPCTLNVAVSCSTPVEQTPGPTLSEVMANLSLTPSNSTTSTQDLTAGVELTVTERTEAPVMNRYVVRNNKNVGVTVELDFSDSNNVQIVSAAAASGLQASASLAAGASKEVCVVQQIDPTTAASISISASTTIEPAAATSTAPSGGAAAASYVAALGSPHAEHQQGFVFDGEREVSELADKINLITTDSTEAPLTMQYQVQNLRSKRIEITLDFAGSGNVEMVRPLGRLGRLDASRTINPGETKNVCVLQQVDTTQGVRLNVGASVVEKTMS